MKRILNLCFFLTFSTFLVGQSGLKIGDWKSYLPYQRGQHISQSESTLFYSTNWSILKLDKEEFSYEFLSKTNGLSDVGIEFTNYDSFNEQLIVSYTNSNIDVVRGQEIINLPQIVQNQNIVGDRSLYDMVVSNESWAYFASGFGLLQLDLQELEFGFTLNLSMRVNSVTFSNGFLYIATEEGVYSIDPEGALNPGDIANWNFLSSDVDLPLIYDATHLEAYNGSIYVVIEDELYRENVDGKFEKIYTAKSGTSLNFLSAEGASLCVGERADVTANVLFFDESNNYITNQGNCNNLLTYAIEDQTGRVWYGDEWDGFRYGDSYDAACNPPLYFNSPYESNTSEITIVDNEVFVASGGVTDGFNFLSRRDGFFIFSDNQWRTYNGVTNSFYNDNDVLNVFRIVKHPTKDIVYAGSFFAGLVEFDRANNTIELHDSGNSDIKGPPGSPGLEKVAGLAFDDGANLWITAYEATEPLIAYTANKTWHSFELESSSKVTQILVDDRGYKWLAVSGGGGGILVYDSGERIEDPGDDRQRFINSSNSVMESNIVNCLEMDLDGDVWVGTAAGPVIFECGDVFADNCTGSVRKVLQDSIPAILLKTEDIRTIAVDGANRKWLGSRNGIFVQSSNGELQELRFQSKSSPLFDDNIIDLSYSDESGEMFIATDKGIQSIRTETLAGGKFHTGEVIAYPNPVRPDYNGPIAIKGLARDSDVKITDVKGQLIYETKALGGQAIWDGKDYNGRKAASGVYLIFSTSTQQFDEPNTAVGKLLFLN